VGLSSKATATIDRIARIHEDKDMYDAREKQLRDQRWMIKSSLKQGLEQGRSEGRKEGLQEGRKEGVDLGKLLGQIKSFQKLIGMEQSSDEELMTKEPAELSALACELENQILKNLKR